MSVEKTKSMIIDKLRLLPTYIDISNIEIDYFRYGREIKNRRRKTMHKDTDHVVTDCKIATHFIVCMVGILRLSDFMPQHLFFHFHVDMHKIIKNDYYCLVEYSPQKSNKHVKINA